MLEAAEFNCVTFDDYNSFLEYRQKAEKTLGVRWLYERSLASQRATISHGGTCGVCWRPCVYSSATRFGETTPNGRVPNWREEQVCDCNYALISRERAVLHYVLATCRPDKTTRLLALSTSRAFGEAVMSLTGAETERSSSGVLLKEVSTASPKVRGSYHTVVSADEFNLSDYDGSKVRAIQSILRPGGRLVFTCPFDINLSPEEQAVDNVVGWSFFTVLKDAGFRSMRAHLYWSEEQGYLGPFNLLFTALV